jgi:CHASE3 domain sensor protein
LAHSAWFLSGKDFSSIALIIFQGLQAHNNARRTVAPKETAQMLDTTAIVLVITATVFIAGIAVTFRDARRQ